MDFTAILTEAQDGEIAFLEEENSTLKARITHLMNELTVANAKLAQIHETSR